MKYFPKNKDELKKLLNDENIRLADINTSFISDMSYLFTPDAISHKYKNTYYEDKNYQNRFCTRTNFDGIENWDTSRVVNMSGMFKGCVYFNKKLNFDTSKVAYMDEMFMDCFRFDSDICFDTSSVVNMRAMFKNCFRFNKPININYTNVEDTSSMFWRCFRLNQKINISSLYLNNSDFMFARCLKLNQQININTPNLYNATRMFFKCRSLNSDVYIKADYLASGAAMFEDCSKLNSDITIDCDRISIGVFMFRNCNSLSNVPNIKYENIYLDSEIFSDCISLKTAPIKKSSIGLYKACFNLKNVDKKTFFEDDFNLDEMCKIEFSNGIFKPKNKEELRLLLSYDFIKLDRIDVSKITDFSYIFVKDEEIVKMLDSKDYNLLNLIRYTEQVKTREDLNGVENWDLSNAKNCDFMFAWCKGFNKKLIYNTKKVESMKAMFLHCKSLDKAPKLDTDNVKDFSFMFHGCNYIKSQESNFQEIKLIAKNLQEVINTKNAQQVCLKHDEEVLEYLFDIRKYLEFVKNHKTSPSLALIHNDIKDDLQVQILSVFYNPQDIKLIDNPNKSVILAAINASDEAVLKDIKTDDFKLCVYAVLKNPKNLNYISHELANNDVFLEEIKKHKNSFDKLNEYFDKSYLQVEEILAQDKPKYYPLDNQELKYLAVKVASLNDIDIRFVDDLSCTFEYSERYDLKDALKWDFTHVKNMKAMFKNAKNFNAKVNLKTPNVSDFSEMFYGCENLNKPIELDFSSAISAKGMFENCTNFNQKIILKNSHKLKNISNMFAYAKNFNQKLDFDTSNVVNFSNMFKSARNFNQELDFNTQNAEDFSGMFCAASSFNQAVKFDTKNAKTMAYMFCTANVFNQELDFDTQNVEDMKAMFCRAFSFNKPLRFNTKKVKNMEKMFENTYNFNQELDFDTTSLKSARDMFYLARAYDKPIKIWQS